MTDLSNLKTTVTQSATPTSSKQKPPFLDWILIAKGIGIVLVVIGHYYPSSSPVYWLAMRKVIYSFHMPLFFLISGFLYRHGVRTYSKLILSKTKRLLFPFLSTASIFLIIKYLAGKLFVLQYPVTSGSVIKLMTDPINSYMPLLWFVHALFIIFASYPLMRKYLNNFFILLLGLIINFYFNSDFPIFGKALSNLPFFVSGVILRERSDYFRMIIGENWHYLALSIFGFIIIYSLKLFIHPVHNPLLFYYLLGLTGSIVIANLSQWISAHGNNLAKKMFITLGKYSMSIYLLHPLFESAVRIGFSQALINIFQLPFAPIALIAIICGVIFPFYLEKYVLRKYTISRKYLLGLN